MKINELKTKKIMLSGGGTGGSVTPLLVLAKKLRQKKENLDIVFVGTKNGPEKKMVLDYFVPGKAINFIAIPSGKLRRYLSWINFIDIFRVIAAFFVSWRVLSQEKPGLLICAGGFVSVPLAYASYIKRIPIVIHQQDVRPGLANRLMAKTAKLVTTTFSKSLADYGDKAQWLGNPAPEQVSEERVAVAKGKYKLTGDKPLLLITGGGTGSVDINNLVYKSLASLVLDFQVMHLTGAGKTPSLEIIKELSKYVDYHWQEIINPDDMFALIQGAAIVVSRCGLATLTELCVLKKAAILIPMPDSHQKDNAAVFQSKEAALVLEQDKLTDETFSKTIKELIADKYKMNQLENNISQVMKRNASEEMANLLLDKFINI